VSQCHTETCLWPGAEGVFPYRAPERPARAYRRLAGAVRLAQRICSRETDALCRTAHQRASALKAQMRRARLGSVLLNGKRLAAGDQANSIGLLGSPDLGMSAVVIGRPPIALAVFGGLSPISRGDSPLRRRVCTTLAVFEWGPTPGATHCQVCSYVMPARWPFDARQPMYIGALGGLGCSWP
jgi:hypothetical protein